MKKLKICLLLQNTFDPDFPSRPEITEIYGHYLPLKGHDITWIMPTIKKNEDCKKKFYGKVNIFQIYYAKSFIYNLFMYYFKKYKLLKQLMEKEKYEIIQVRNDFLDGLLVLLLKKRYDFVFIFNYSFPKGCYKNNSNILIKLKRKLDEILTEYIIKKSDFVLPITDWMKEDLVNKGLGNKMMPLPMGVNIKNFSPDNRKNLKKKYQLNTKKIFLYLGTLDNTRNIGVIIEAFSKVKRNKSDICLWIVGSGNSEDNLKKQVSDLGLKNHIIFAGQVSYFKIPDIIFTADICLSPIPPISCFKISSPTKLFEYMAMEKPTIANKGIFEQEKVLTESGAGILVNFDSNSFADGMIELLENPHKTGEMGEKGRKWVLNNRDYKKMALNIEKLYFKLI